MKLFKTALITLGLLLCCLTAGYADRLYTWMDAKGVIHITQEPPPPADKLIDVMNYSEPPGPPAPQQTVPDGTNQQQGNSDQGSGQAASGPSTGVASGDVGDNVEYEYTGDSYWQTLRSYERRSERLDSNQPVMEGERPEIVRPGRGRR